MANRALGAYIRIFGNHLGNVQILDGGGASGSLRIVANRGFKKPFLQTFAAVSVNDSTPCARALRTGHISVVRDTNTDRAFAPYRALAKEAGFRSIVSMPIITAKCGFIGVISSHSPAVGAPSPEQLRRAEKMVARFGEELADALAKTNNLRESQSGTLLPVNANAAPFFPSGFEFLSGVPCETMSFAPGQKITRNGEYFSHIYLITNGWAHCSSTLRNGTRRVINFQLPGDFICLDAFKFPTAARDWHALTRLDVFGFKPSDFTKAVSQRQDHVDAMASYYAKDLALVSAHLLDMGGRSATERLTHFCLELWHRLRQVGMANGNSYLLPMTVGLMADAVGLTPDHVTRTLHRLSADGIVEVNHSSPREVKILSESRAVALSGFDIESLRLQQP
jgi:CRP-like cAMP-binding protein